MKGRRPFDYPPPATRGDKETPRTPATVPPVPPRVRRVVPIKNQDLTDDFLNSLLADSEARNPVPSTDIPPLPPPAPRREVGTRERRLETQRTWRSPVTQATPKPDGPFLNVPMICASTDRPFVLRFRKKGGLFSKSYGLDSVVTELDSDGEALLGLSVPTDQMAWTNIRCPHCNALCRPIHCGRCEKLVCDGRSSESIAGLYFRCAPSCGASGPCGDGLTSIRGNAASGAPERRLLASPTAIAQTLPKNST
jgi:hypothetical protein